jgi:maltoporin
MVLEKALGGTSKTGVQYGIGSAVSSNGVVGSLSQPTDTNFQRVIENFDFQPTPELGGQFVGVFNREHDAAVGTTPEVTSTWISIGGRVSYAFHPNAQIMLDAGFDTVKPDNGDRRNVFKVGIAPAITAGKGYWARPQLRLFASLGFWNDAARAAGVDSSGIYTGTTKTFGANFGMQAESWW